MSIVVGFTGSGICHETSGPQIEAKVGVLIFERTLSFETSPSIGLGVGHGITNFLQLNLAFAFSPAQQTISTAVSKLETRVYVFKYSINFRVATPKSLAFRLTPYFESGVGGSALNPQSATIDLGGGTVIQTNPKTDHNFALSLGAGVMLALSKNLDVKIEWRNDLYRLDKVLDDGVNTESILGRDAFLGAGLMISF